MTDETTTQEGAPASKSSWRYVARIGETCGLTVLIGLFLLLAFSTEAINIIRAVLAR